MEMKGNHGLGNSSTCNGDIQGTLGDKFMQWSDDQVMVLEQFFVECQSPSHSMRLAMIRENSVLSNLDSQQIEAWFESRRSLEKNKMAATGKLLLLEQNYLHGTVQQLLREKEYYRMMLQYTSLESFPAPEIPRSVFENLKIVAERRQQLLLENEYLHNEVQHLQRGNEYVQILLENVDDITNSEAAVNPDLYFPGDVDNTRGLLLFSETMTKFPPKTPIACDWVSIPRMKFFERIKEIFVRTCLDWTHFPVSGITVDASAMLSFVKATTLPYGLLDLFLCQHQEFVVSCSIKDIKLDQLCFKDGEKSLTAIVPAFLLLDIKLSQISFKEKEESLTGAASSFMPQNIKLDKIAFKDREESLTAVSSAFLPQRFCVAVDHFCVLGAWHYVPNQQAASGEVKFMLRFKFIN
ncbi:hypothetical protein POM88_048622 [Heracleum sosnowskyi]|uniref:Homeobox domain-containing protein n=1 Tax=Heracleum sosnowskyi TaxID=360622 RepID=A0AAD8LZS6_9APIA|nr:hypothetical protein POM88_048622 [Heracleum sosnowskyi]